MNKPDLKNCSTEELFKELESREGVQKFYAGPYQLYDIFPKYGAPLLTESSARLKAVAMRLGATSDTADSLRKELRDLRWDMRCLERGVRFYKIMTAWAFALAITVALTLVLIGVK